MINYIVSIFFIVISLAYLILAIKYYDYLQDESPIICILAGIFCAYCFLFSGQAGFLNVYECVFLQFPYFFMIYAGNRSIHRSAKLAIEVLEARTKKEMKDRRRLEKLYNRYYEIHIMTFLLITFATIYIGFIMKSNFIIMFVHLEIVLYLITGTIINTIYLKKIELLTLKTMLLNYGTIACVVSLYEIAYFALVASDINYYSAWGHFYIDPLHKVSFVWIILCLTFLLIVPRFYYYYKSKGGKK